MFRRMFAGGLVLTVACFLGCQPTKELPPPAGENAAHDEGHDHAHGPNGGPLFSMGEAPFKGEALSNSKTGLVQIFFVDAEGKANYPVAAEKVVVRHSLAGDKTYELLPVEPDGEGRAAQFSLSNIELTDLVGHDATCEVVVDGKTYTGTVEVH